MAIDLICKMKIDEKNSIKLTYKNKIYCFCSDGCKETFEKNPGKFIQR